MISVIFGGTRIGNREAFSSQSFCQTLDILAAHSVTTIDTAQAYGRSEATLGDVHAGDGFTIDTKWSPPSYGPCPAWATRENIIASAENSLQKLRVKQVNVFYLHKPDPNTPISETLDAVDHVYKRGRFMRFGLSGCSAAQVEEVHNHCRENDYVLPTVYQGSYNPLSRSKETTLFPTLRRLEISFYAYGVSAGGFLCKSPEMAAELARDMAAVSATCRPYLQQEKYAVALAAWNAVAHDEGITGAELVYRWVTHHSALSARSDAVILGASSPAQLEQTLTAIERGPLSGSACAAVHRIMDVLNQGGE